MPAAEAAGTTPPNSRQKRAISSPSLQRFKIRSRFVDFPGKFVLHCHILGHEDRGMMQLVEVVDNHTVIKHH